MPTFWRRAFEFETKAERKYRTSSKTFVNLNIKLLPIGIFQKLLEKRRLYIENELMENCSRKKFTTLKLLPGQDVEQLPKYENRACKQLQRVLYI